MGIEFLVKKFHYGTKKRINISRKNKIFKKLAPGITTLQISKQLSRGRRTMKKIAEFGIQTRKKRNQSEFRMLKARDLSHIKQQLVETPNVLSKSFFDACVIDNVPRTTRHKSLKEVSQGEI